MAKLIICRGLPASGKTTWAKKYQEDNPNTVRVNKDDLRAMLHNSKHSKGREDFVLRTRDFIVSTALSEGKDVVVDDTNLNPIHEEQLRAIAATISGNKTKDYVRVEVQDFTDVSVSECIKRDKDRTKSVGPSVIRDMYRKYLQPQPIPYDKTLPDAVICDLDGTLCLFGNNSPYDRDFIKDTVNPAVKSILDMYIFADSESYTSNNEVTIIFMSGRDSKHRDVTKKWLTKHGFSVRHLYMRALDDRRKDFIVKKELYENHIKGKYNVLFALDDRNQVVDLWRSMGITCLQVADGDF